MSSQSQVTKDVVYRLLIWTQPNTCTFSYSSRINQSIYVNSPYILYTFVPISLRKCPFSLATVVSTTNERKRFTGMVWRAQYWNKGSEKREKWKYKSSKWRSQLSCWKEQAYASTNGKSWRVNIYRLVLKENAIGFVIHSSKWWPYANAWLTFLFLFCFRYSVLFSHALTIACCWI